MTSVEDNFSININWRPKVLVTHYDTPKVALELLKKYCDVTICETFELEELLKKCKGVDGLYWSTWGAHNRLTAEVLDAVGPQIKSISVCSAGFDFVDLEEIKKRKIPLGYAAKVLNNSVADIAVGLAIAASRRFYEGRQNIEQSAWEKRPQWMLGQDIRGSTVGIVGFGGIGQTIAKRLTGFDVGQFLYSGHNKKPEADKIGAKFVPFSELATKSDFIFVICPLTSETYKLFNAGVFDKMKPTSVLVNVARGDVVDQEALYDALKKKKIFAAGLDVMTPEPLPADHPLMSLSNCVIIPHLGAATTQTRNAMAMVAAINVLSGLADQPMHSPAY